MNRVEMWKNPDTGFNVTGLVAEWLCSGLQIRVRRFNSDPGLQFHEKPDRKVGLFLFLRSAPRKSGSRKLARVAPQPGWRNG